MTQAKAADVSKLLILAGKKHRILENNGDWIFYVNDDAGVDIDTLKTFQDNQQVTIKTTIAIIS